MKILVVCQHYYPENFQITDICEELVKHNNQVTVLTGIPNYPQGEFFAGYDLSHHRHEKRNGVEIIRAREIPRHKGLLHLAINYISFCLFASLKALTIKRDFDVIYAYQLSPILMVIPAIILKYLTGKKLFLYCCDLWPESCEAFISRNSFFYKVIKFFSTWIYRQSDVIGVESEDFLDYFVRRHQIDKNRLLYIPQFADSSYLDKDFTKPHENINFVFLGNVGKAQNLDCFVEAFSKVKTQSKFLVHIVGTGSFLTELKAMVKGYDLQSKFIFHGRHPVEEMGKFYAIADVCIMGLTGQSIIGHTIPNKLQGYMAAGKTVIAAIDGAAGRVIQSANCGIAVPAGDVDALSKGIQDFLDHPETYKMCGENGRRYFKEHFHKDQHIKSVETVIETLNKEEADQWIPYLKIEH